MSSPASIKMRHGVSDGLGKHTMDARDVDEKGKDGFQQAKRQGDGEQALEHRIFSDVVPSPQIRQLPSPIPCI